MSSRHLSFIETGRAQPSRDMVLLFRNPVRERQAARNAFFSKPQACLRASDLSPRVR